MIFVTIGTQQPFDRFISIIDEIAGSLEEEVVAQVLTGKYEPQNMRVIPDMTAEEFDEMVAQSRLVVSHAGMGTILTAMRQSKPIVVFPRDCRLGEHRNDHQMATARSLAENGYIHVAYDADSLRRLVTDPDIASLHTVGPQASPELVQFVADFIAGK